MRITASSLLLSLEPIFDTDRNLRTSEDQTKLSTMLHWISNIISPNTAASLIIQPPHVVPLFQFYPQSFQDQRFTPIGYHEKVIFCVERRKSIWSWRRIPGFRHWSLFAGNGYKTKSIAEFPTFQSCHRVPMFQQCLQFWRLSLDLQKRGMPGDFALASLRTPPKLWRWKKTSTTHSPLIL